MLHICDSWTSYKIWKQNVISVHLKRNGCIICNEISPVPPDLQIKFWRAFLYFHKLISRPSMKPIFTWRERHIHTVCSSDKFQRGETNHHFANILRLHCGVVEMKKPDKQWWNAVFTQPQPPSQKKKNLHLIVQCSVLTALSSGCFIRAIKVQINVWVE